MNRPWNITDLSGAEEQIADRLLGDYFTDVPGAVHRLAEFDEAICAKYGFKRVTRQC